VQNQTSIFTGNNFEAIIGLAYPIMAEKGIMPVFDSMMKQGALKSNMFAFYLTNMEAELMGLHSDLTFGYYDKSKFKGQLDWHPILFQYMYGVKLDDIKVGGKALNLCS
jgi:saccharopepsin